MENSNFRPMHKLLTGVLLIAAFAVMLTGCGVIGGNAKEAEEEKQILGFVDGYNPLIEEVQNILMKAGFDSGSINGRLDKQTRDAIKEFQKVNNLKVTGFVNLETRIKLDSYKMESEAIATSQEPAQAGQTADQGEQVSSDIIKQRLQDPEWVKKIQNALQSAGFDAGAADGKMGGKTRAAVSEFQKSKGLTPDGVIGKKTWEELSKYFTQDAASDTAVSTASSAVSEAVSGEMLSSDDIKERLMDAEWIKKIQQALIDAGFDPGTPDGKMGSKTKNAVIEFQKSKGLAADGVIGRKTWEELSKYFAQEQTVSQ